MKALMALLALVAMAATANAREPLNENVGVYVFDAAKNTGTHIGQVNSDILEFADENDCRHKGNNARCVYQMPLEGLAEPVMIGVGRVAGELVILVTDVPTRTLDFIAAGFASCADSAPDKLGEAVCNGFAFTFDAAGEIYYGVGHYNAESVGMTSRTLAQTFEFGSNMITNLTRGNIDEAAKDFVAGGPLTLGCLLLSPFNLILDGKGINCDEWVANERTNKMD